MQQLTADRHSTAQTAGISLLTLVAVLLLAWVAAYWTWVWLAPSPIARAQAAPSENRRTASADFLFGTASIGSERSLSASIGITLLGIVATSASGKGFALLHLDPGQTIAVEEGNDIVPGIRLADIGVDHVVLERGAERETLAWPSKPAVAASPVALPVLRTGK